MEHDKRQPDTFEQINVMAQAPKRDYFLPASIIIAAILIGGAILFATFYKGGSAVPNAPTAGAGNQGAGQPSSAFAAAMKLGPTDVALGSANAPVTIIEYGDYQCPYCAMFFSNTQPALVANYVTTGKAKFVFRNFVVNDRTAQNHESHNAALAVACANDQGKFWQFHDAVYQLEAKDEAANPQTAENNGNLNRTAFVGIAATLGMDQGKFASCFDSGKYAVQIQQESSQAQAYGINATPSFIINGQQVVGAQPLSAFQAVIDPLLKS